MKTLVLTGLITLQSVLAFSQSADDNFLAYADNNDMLTSYTEVLGRIDKKSKDKDGDNIISAEELGKNGFDFELIDAGINTKYSEYSSGYFRNKFILVSSKKVGGLDKIDKNTSEAFPNLYCADIKKDGSLKKPYLFSRILNTTHSEGQVSFSPDEHVIYFTRSKKDNSLNYKLYKAELESKSHGNWHNIVEVFGDDNYSVENPYVSPDGRKLYFSSNKPGGFGGFDLYVSEIMVNGKITAPVNLGPVVNTAKDEKYPTLSKDGRDLYFSSNGHITVGGFDVLTSKIVRDEYRKPRNLGNTINSQYDEVAFYLSRDGEQGYVSINKDGGYDISRFSLQILDEIQSLDGSVVDAQTKTPLTNVSVVLLDEKGEELDAFVTKRDAKFQFDVKPTQNYTIKVSKDGFKDNSVVFTADQELEESYNKVLELQPAEAIIKKVAENKRVISIENIYFDSNKWNIKPEARLALDKVQFVMSDNPSMKIRINAHTDNVGKESFNQELSAKRASSAKAYLTIKGIAADRIETVGYGETKPLIDCKDNCTESINEVNRRIEFVVIED